MNPLIARLSDGVVCDIRVAAETVDLTGWVSIPHYVRMGSRLDGEQWLHPTGRSYTADERRYRIAPMTLLGRVTAPELKAVIGMALGTSPSTITDAQESAWRLLLMLGTTGEILSDGIAAATLPSLFGATRAAELLAPDPTFAGP